MMSHDLTRKGDAAVLTLDGDLDIRHAEEISRTFIRALAEADHLELCLRNVTAADQSFLQLLCSAHRTAMRLNKRLAFAGPWPALVDRAMGAAGFERRAGCKLDSGNSCLWVRRDRESQPAS